MDAVDRKLDYVMTADTPDLRQAANQLERLRKEAARDRKGLIERVSYTWFNRIAALRFLDARDWHPFRSRVITAATPEEMQPEILKLLRTGSFPEELHSHTDLKRLNDLLDGRLPTAIAGADPQGEVYRELVLTACRFYHATMPFLFERIDDESELLLPDDLLTANSVIEGFRTEISDEDCSEVEILGWLYQFYISEKKDAVMARKSAVPTEDIPAVTQLFTPHWIVRYLVENSLGRLWMLNHPTSKLREQMPYYIEGEAGTDFLKIGKPEEIKLVDPAVGSGHMLTYAFDLLVKIYEEEGYAPSEIPEKILTHNLYGLEICPRAAQLAQFALVCKAREISRTAFRTPIQPQVICLQDISFEENELKEYIDALKLGSLFSQPVLKQMHQFEQATNFGSLIQPCLDEKAIQELQEAIEGKELGSQLFLHESHRKVMRVLKQAKALSQQYHVVVANPPYMGSGSMNASLKELVQKGFGYSRGDLFGAFIDRGLTLAVSGGGVALITMHSWMFLSSYERLRKKIIRDTHVLSLLHLGPRAFESIGGEVVQTCAFSLSNKPTASNIGRYYRLVDEAGEVAKRDKFLESKKAPQNESGFMVSTSSFESIPGEPFAYWTSPRVKEIFDTARSLADFVSPTHGIATGDNDTFLRQWHEVGSSRTGFGMLNRDAAKASKCRWFPVSKGGSYRKWYGNNEYVINWENDGYLLQTLKHSTGRIRATNFNLGRIFREGITWSTLSSDSLSMRYSPPGMIFESKGSTCFCDDRQTLLSALALCNSNLVNVFLLALAPTLDYHEGPLGRVPMIVKDKDSFAQTAERCVEVARADWDNFETSWDFRDYPLLRQGLRGSTLAKSWQKWEAESTAAIRQMQELERENNRLFINAYGLQDELSPEVPEDQITLARADRRKDMVAFLSYAIGCMMGRFSLDKLGLILADAGDSVQEYLHKIGKPLDQIAFPPDEDGIIPIVEGEWFPDDIVARTREFLRVTFGESTLNENLHFIEESLGKSLEKYFLNDFYKDHISNERAYGYKKRPIYWLFQSPKKGFSALVYLHRYTKDTCNTLLNGYLREFIKKIDAKITHLEHVSATADSAREKTAAAKEMEKLRKVLKECQDWERDVLLPLAQRRLEIDLDDGVKVNYLKFGNALATIPGLAGKEEE
jgi:hypothetical protein